MNLPKGVSLDSSNFLFYQENDSCDSGKNGQELQIKIEDAGAGKFLIIKTKRWAIDFDEIHKFSNILK